MFKKAERKQAKLRLALTGPSGSGKTYSALMIAKGMGGKIAVLDTEHSSASLYSDLVDFDVAELSAPFSPERYVEVIKGAEKEYDILIIDSMTHEWNGTGGILETNTSIANAKFKGNTYAAWGETTPRHNRFIEAILQSSLHVIVTMRSKQDFILTEGRNGKQAPKKIGMAPVQRDGMEYEFTVVLDISNDGNMAVASKDRTRLFNGDPACLNEEHGERLVEWLNSGESPEEEAKNLLSEVAKQGMEALKIRFESLDKTTKKRIVDYIDDYKKIASDFDNQSNERAE